jgi:hypothetical protein
MNEAPAKPEFQQELEALLEKHRLDTHTTPAVLARYLIRQLDNFRETLQESNDDIRNPRRVGSTPEETGDN